MVRGYQNKPSNRTVNYAGTSYGRRIIKGGTCHFGNRLKKLSGMRICYNRFQTH
jgi:hypothetical protein